MLSWVETIVNTEAFNVNEFTSKKEYAYTFNIIPPAHEQMVGFSICQDFLNENYTFQSLAAYFYPRETQQNLKERLMI